VEFKFINTEYLETVSGGDRSIARELVEIFRAQVVEFAGEMKNLLAAGDYYSLGLLAHKAKSSIAIMGMNDLASMLKTFELDAKESRGTEKYESYISRFEQETSVAVTELDYYLNNE